MRFERHGGYYYCSMCEHFTRKSNALSMHISIKHNKETPHACKQCHLKFKTRSLLQQHIISKHTQSVIPCNHYGCTETFKTQPVCHEESDLSKLLFKVVPKCKNTAARVEEEIYQKKVGSQASYVEENSITSALARMNNNPDEK